MSQSGDFGRRGITSNSTQETRSAPPENGTTGTSPFVKQIGGMALGVAITVALGAGSVHLMKQMGKSLDGKFIEAASQGNPQAAIGMVKQGEDRVMQRVHQTCTDTTSTIGRGTVQTRDAWLCSAEQSLLRAGAYVACLATEQPQRFCEKSHREHLVKAVHEYLKMRRKVREEWMFQPGGPNVHSIMRTGVMSESDQHSPIGSPSSQFDPRLREGLRTLAANGLLTAREFGGFAGIGAPLDVVDAMKGIQARKNTCT